jgi:hypothetical protein
MDKFEDTLVLSGLNSSGIAKYLAELQKKIKSALSENDVAARVPYYKEISMISAEELQKYVTAKASIEQKIESLKRDVLAFETDDTQDKIQQAESELQSARERLQGLYNQQSAAMSYSWIPSLAVRVGSVVIALFLIQFYASIYRYNTCMRRYYDSRADILQIAGKSSDNLWLNVQDAALLAEKFADKSDFVLPSDPTSNFVSTFAGKK